jgi:hypothetical protein
VFRQCPGPCSDRCPCSDPCSDPCSVLRSCFDTCSDPCSEPCSVFRLCSDPCSDPCSVFRVPSVPDPRSDPCSAFRPCSDPHSDPCSVFRPCSDPCSDRCSAFRPCSCLVSAPFSAFRRRSDPWSDPWSVSRPCSDPCSDECSSFRIWLHPLCTTQHCTALQCRTVQYSTALHCTPVACPRFLCRRAAGTLVTYSGGSTRTREERAGNPADRPSCDSACDLSRPVRRRSQRVRRAVTPSRGASGPPGSGGSFPCDSMQSFMQGLFRASVFLPSLSRAPLARRAGRSPWATVLVQIITARVCSLRRPLFVRGDAVGFCVALPVQLWLRWAPGKLSDLVACLTAGEAKL